MGREVARHEQRAGQRHARRDEAAGLLPVTSDHHQSQKNTIARVLDAPWQRCTVRSARTTHGHCRPSQRAEQAL